MCKTKNGGCHVQASCSIGPNGYAMCACMPGYNGDGYSCTSQCAVANGNCDKNAQCTLSEKVNTHEKWET